MAVYTLYGTHYTRYQLTYSAIGLKEVTTNILGGSAFSQGTRAAAQTGPDLASEIFKLEPAALIQKIVDSIAVER